MTCNKYSQRSYVVIECIRYCENEIEASITKSTIEIMKSDLQLLDITENNVDKCHQIGPTDEDGEANIIIKSTKYSTPTKFFRKRTKLSKLISWKKYVKFCNFLQRNWQNLLTYTCSLCTEAVVCVLTFQTLSEVSKQLHHINLLFFR